MRPSIANNIKNAEIKGISIYHIIEINSMETNSNIR